MNRRGGSASLDYSLSPITRVGVGAGTIIVSGDGSAWSAVELGRDRLRRSKLIESFDVMLPSRRVMLVLGFFCKRVSEGVVPGLQLVDGSISSSDCSAFVELSDLIFSASSKVVWRNS